MKPIISEFQPTREICPVSPSRGVQPKIATARFCIGLFVILATLSAGLSARAQAPGLIWSNNIGANLFALDSLANVYASTNGTVYKLNSAGVPIQTNTICPLPGIAQRDSSGNYYFLGSFDGTQDFGGITLVGGWTNWSFGGQPPKWQPGWPSCFLAKYDSGGSLLWVDSFGLQAARNRADDLAMNPDGSVTVAFDISGMETLAQFSAAGSQLWQSAVAGSPAGTCVALKVSGLVGGIGTFVRYNVDNSLSGGFYDTAGNLTWFTGGPILWRDPLVLNGKPVPGTNNDGYAAGLTVPPNYQPILTKWQGQVLERSQNIGGVEQWLLTSDIIGNVYLAGTNGLFSKYDSWGNLLWSTNYGTPVTAMEFDAYGDGFICFTNGAIARLDLASASTPALGISVVNSMIVLSWPSIYTNYSVMTSTSLTGGWMPMDGAPVLYQDRLVMSNALSDSGAFFRLQPN
jgi:hypothetical protein